MSTKSKGSKAERELLHMFWSTNIWAALRAPGSGSVPLPSPDILASNAKRYLAIECKSVRDPKKYFPNEEIEQLVLFAKRFGAEPWVGVRFDREGWYFLKPTTMLRSEGNNFYYVTLEHAQKKGLSFQQLISI